ncbi:hypothetical protein HDV04_000763 [Boothiomyces sp. JEL0838]|nr:hypothetical protein HDV04_000763 [Boothiomyces sp. JEL0838]
MGINFDGTYHDDIDITTVDGALACAVMGLFLIWTFIVIGVVVRDVMASPKKMTSKNLLVVQLIFLLFEILQIIINTPLCTPFLFWLTNIVGSFALLLINIAQMQVLKSFCVLSKRLTPRILDILRNIDICLFIIMMLGSFISLGNIGRPSDSELLNMWRIFGPGIFAFIVVVFECWHVYFILTKIQKFQKMNSFLGKDISADAKRASHYMKILAIFDVIISLMGLVIYVGAIAFLNGAQLYSISAIGATLGEGHSLTSSKVTNLVTFYFKLVKQMNQHSKKKEDASHQAESSIQTK